MAVDLVYIYIMELKEYWSIYGNEVYIFIVFFVIAVFSFFLGRISVDNEKAFIVNSYKTDSGTNSQITTGNIAASINGTKYYYTWCSGINRIKEENLIYFNTEEEAQATGYTLAKNCK